MTNVKFHVIDPDGSRSGTTNLTPGSRLEIKGPLREDQSIWIFLEPDETPRRDLLRQITQSSQEDRR